MTSTSTPEPLWPTSINLTTGTGSPKPGGGTMPELTARAAAASARDRQALADLAATQMDELVNQLTRRSKALVTGYDKQLHAALRSTLAGTNADLGQLQDRTTTAVRRVRRAMIWPPLAALLAAALIVGVGSLIGASRSQGIPATTITNRSGQPVLVLTEPGWTTCKWQGHRRPCRRIDPPTKSSKK